MSLLWEKFLRPLAFSLDAERAHELGIKALQAGLASPFYRTEMPPGLEVERFGLRFRNPLGVAAGFDKNGVVVDQLSSLGFGFVEVGTVTARPQPGNPKPRLFRFLEHKALVNRLGFNNDGASAVARRLVGLSKRCVVGVNIGRNKDVDNDRAIENYLEAFSLLQPAADYVAINVSSPNTPNLREMQQSENLAGLLSAVRKANTELGPKPLLVKIAPDLTEGEIEAVVATCVDQNIDGIIATNTTVSREPSMVDVGPGGMSGRPLAELSNKVIASIYRHSGGKLPIIGVGGVFTAGDAFQKITAGASLIQAYTGFVYQGPGFAHQVLDGLAEILKEKGFASIEDAVGSEISKYRVV